MAIILLLYLFFLIAMALPQVGFWSKAFPELTVNIASWGTVGFIGSALLLLWLYPRGTNDVFPVHATRLQRILVMMATGGLVDAMRYLIFYEQFQLKYNISTILYYVLIVLWVSVFIMIMYGVYDLVTHWWLRGKSSAAR